MTPSEHDELQKALRVLAERIVKTCREEIEKAHFDKTYTAKIVGVKSNNQYVVEYNGKQLTVKGQPSARFNLGDYVRILSPQNNIKNTIIIPKTGSSGDPSEGGNSHTHSNLDVLHQLTQKMIDNMGDLKALAFKSNVDFSDLTAELLAEINKISSKANLTDIVQTDWAEANSSSKAFLKNKPSSLPASDVYSWAKQPNKPTYTATEVGALPADTELHTHSNKSVLDKITQSLIDAWNSAVSATHSHSNKTILDSITTTLITKWNSTYDHISDAIKHVTSSERNLWNTVSNKANISDVLSKTNTTSYTPSDTYNPATKKYVDDKIDVLDYGDMLKSVYDSDNDGVIDRANISDNAEKVCGKIVNNALDTDVLWTADKIRAELNQNLPAQLLQWSGTVIENQTIDFSIPNSEGYKTNSLEVLLKDNNGNWTKAIHAVDYGYTFENTSNIKIKFFNAGIYTVNYGYCALGTLTMTKIAASEPTNLNADDIWLEVIS